MNKSWTLLMLIAIECGIAGSSWAQTSLREQEAQRLTAEARQIQTEQQSLATTRAWLEKEKSVLQQASNTIRVGEQLLKTQVENLAAYRRNWRCPEGLSLDECSAHGYATSAAWNYINSRASQLRTANDQLDRARREFNVRHSRFKSQADSFNYRNTESNSRMTRYNGDLSDYRRRYEVGTAAVEGTAAGATGGESLVFDDAVPKKGK